MSDLSLGDQCTQQRTVQFVCLRQIQYNGRWQLNGIVLCLIFLVIDGRQCRRVDHLRGVVWLRLEERSETRLGIELLESGVLLLEFCGTQERLLITENNWNSIKK